jgi:hypothetical protein
LLLESRLVPKRTLKSGSYDHVDLHGGVVMIRDLLVALNITAMSTTTVNCPRVNARTMESQ